MVAYRKGFVVGLHFRETRVCAVVFRAVYVKSDLWLRAVEHDRDMVPGIVPGNKTRSSIAERSRIFPVGSGPREIAVINVQVYAVIARIPAPLANHVLPGAV